MRPPFARTDDTAPSAAALRDASLTGNPRQPGELAAWAQWTVDLPVGGSYTFSAECWWLDEKGNSLFLQVYDGPEQVFGSDSTLQRWHLVTAPSPLVLSAGRDVIRLVNREDGSKVRRLILEGLGQ